MATNHVHPTPTRREVRGPFFDELNVGDVFDDAPALTLTDGLRATHRAIVGNRLRISLDDQLGEAVTGSSGLVSPALVWDVSIGQSTSVTQHVRANLYYRRLSFQRLPVVGDTLATVTTVDALRPNRPRPGRPPTGMAALNVVTRDQEDRVVLDYWRCAMLPFSPGASASDTTVSDEEFDRVGTGLVPNPTASVSTWDLQAFRDMSPGLPSRRLVVGDTWSIDGADVVSSAPELARLTGNLAEVHHDAQAAGGRRLVYGGHTIGLAFHQLCRAVPQLLTALAWERCDHLGPVHEDDSILSEITLTNLEHIGENGQLARFHVASRAISSGGEPRPVLDWVVLGVVA